MATPVVLTTGARPITAVESGGVPMTPVDTLGEPVTVVDALGEPVVLINNDGTPAFLAYSAKTYLGGVAPYHWLDFVDNRALYAGADVGNVTGATGYSFSRASQGYYTNSDGTLTLFGYNLCLQSETFENATWQKARCSIVANQYTAPDGTLTGDQLVEDTTTNSHPVFQTIASLANATAYTFSIYLLAVDRTSANIAFSNTAFSTGCNVTFTLSGAGTATPAGTIPSTATIEAVGGGWYRCTVTATSISAGSGDVFVQPFNGATSYLGNGLPAIGVWGAQLEPSASLGSYVPTTTSAAGALRRGDRGVLIEGSRTNLLLQSQTLGTTWTAQRTTITENTIAAPDGTTTADTVLETVDSGSHGVFQAITKAASSITYALSCHIKPNGRNWAILQLDSAGETNRVRVWFDLTGSGVVGSNAAGGTGFSFVSASIQALANGWYRCVAVITGDTNTTHTLHVRPATADTTLSYTGDITKGLYLWGAQLEAASFPSSYIPTTSASVTRAADSLSISDARSAPFSMFAEFEPVGTANQNDIIAYDTLTNGSGIYLTPTPAAWVRESSVTTAIATGGGAAVVGSVSRVAARFAVNDTLLCNAGTLGSADTSNSPPSTTVLKFAPSIFGGVQSVYLRRVAIIASGATNAQLQAMTPA